MEQNRAMKDHQRQLEHVQKSAEANADRTRRRMEAEVKDLETSIGKLEADLSRASVPHSKLIYADTI